jgi:flagella basal body P-ring formation protein FlgA
MSAFSQTFENEVRNHLMMSFPQYENIEVYLSKISSSDEKIIIDKTRPVSLSRGIALIPIIAAKGLKTGKSVFSVKIKLMQKVFIAADDLEKHKALSKQTLVEKTIDITNINGTPVSTDAVIDQYRTKSFVQKGEILFDERIEKIPLISIGDKVDAEVRAGNVTVRTEAVARQNGGNGDLIEIVSSGNKIIKARIIDANKVIVE